MIFNEMEYENNNSARILEETMDIIEFDHKNEYSARIKVIGVGGGGSNAVNAMVRNKIRGVEFIIANTDVQALEAGDCEEKIQLGANVTRGLGAGSKPDKGRQAAEESENQIREIMEEADMVFITAGMGGGTGTGAAPIVSRIAKEAGALTVGVVTKPFAFEGKQRALQAEVGIEELNPAVDTLIVIPNQKLINFADKDMPFTAAFALVDDVLKQAVCSISDLIVTHGEINPDFADVQTIMEDMGKALMGSGIASGENRAMEAAQKAISSPLLDEASVDGAMGLLINITGGNDLKLSEVAEACTLIQENAHKEANIIWGQAINPDMEGQMQVTVIATGFDKKPEAQPRLRKVVNGEPLVPGDSTPFKTRKLKTLAKSIQEGNGNYDPSSIDYDIPPILRNQAD